MSIKELNTLFEKAESLQTLLIDRATGRMSNNDDYKNIRQELMQLESVEHLIPVWVKTNRNLDQFWQFIKNEFEHYQERRVFIWDQFSELLEVLEVGYMHPAEINISKTLEGFDTQSINSAWSKALKRTTNDPEGAITLSRTIIESVCKHILEDCNVTFNSNMDLSELYKLTAKELNLAPERYGEQVFKQILGGCSGIVNGLGNLRNKLGDAHGTGRKPVRPKPRHAQLAVNLAGTMALFLISTHEQVTF